MGEEPLFVGRDEEQQLYRNFLGKASPWMLVITGLGGSGKTTLLRQLVKQDIEDSLVVKLDFALQPSFFDALSYLDLFVEQVRNACNTQKYAEFERKLKTARSQAVPGYMAQIVRAETNATIEDIHANIDPYDVFAAVRRDARASLTKVFIELMNTFIPKRLVIILDHCEWLSEPENFDDAQWILVDILRKLHDEMFSKGKMFHTVMMSSVRLESYTSKLRLNKLIDEEDRIHHYLNKLDEEAVTKYFVYKKVKDADMYQYLYKITYGHAACVVDVCNFWAKLREEERPSKLSSDSELLMFRKNFYEYAIREFVRKHIWNIRQLKEPYYNLTRYGIILRRFNMNLLVTVFEGLFKSSKLETKLETEECFGHFVDRLHVVHLEHHEYEIVELLRTICSDFIRTQHPDEWKEYHRLAFTSLIPLKTARRSDWFYHRLALELANSEQQDLGYWQTLLEEMEVRKQDLTPLLDAAYDKTLMFTPIPLAAKAYADQRNSP